MGAYARALPRIAPGVAAVGAGLVSAVGVALAEQRVVGEFTSTGMVFKDRVEVLGLDDPKVDGVTIYLSHMRRPITDRFHKDFFTDPSQGDVTVAQTGPLKISPDICKNKEGEDVFTKSKNLFFKALNVRRIFDEERGVLLYVSYTSRLYADADERTNSRYRTSLAAIPIPKDHAQKP